MYALAYSYKNIDEYIYDNSKDVFTKRYQGDIDDHYGSIIDNKIDNKVVIKNSANKGLYPKFVKQNWYKKVLFKISVSIRLEKICFIFCFIQNIGIHLIGEDIIYIFFYSIYRYPLDCRRYDLLKNTI